MGTDESDFDGMTTIIVQFPVEGFGTEAEFDLRCRMDELLDDALKKSANGICDGGDSGSGSMNLFLIVKDVSRAIPTILSTLRDNQLLTEGVVVAESLRGDDLADDYKVWWPEKFSGEFCIF